MLLLEAKKQTYTWYIYKGPHIWGEKRVKTGKLDVLLPHPWGKRRFYGFYCPTRGGPYPTYGVKFLLLFRVPFLFCHFVLIVWRSRHPQIMLAFTLINFKAC